MAWPVRSISARGRPTCAAARLTVAKKFGALTRLEHEAMRSLPPGANTPRASPVSLAVALERAGHFVFPLGERRQIYDRQLEAFTAPAYPQPKAEETTIAPNPARPVERMFGRRLAGPDAAPYPRL